MRKIDFLGILLLFIFFGFSGCNKEDVLNSKNGNMNSDLIEIRVSVDGVEEFMDVPATRANGGEMTARHWFPLGDTCWMQATVISKPMEKKVQTKAVLANIRFRVVAYQGEVLAGQGEYKTGEGGIAAPVGTPLALAAGTYDFMFYSYGNDQAIPELSGGNSVEVSLGTDLLWCKKAAQVVNASGFELTGVKFERRASSIRLVVNPLATGFDVTECAATLTGLYEGNATFDISRGLISTTSLPVTGSQAFSFPSLGTGVVASQSSCILPQDGFAGTLTFDKLKVGDDYSGLKMAIPSVTFSSGYQYEIHIKILPFGKPEGSTILAPGLLKKDGADYYFTEGIPYSLTADGGSFFTYEEALSNPCAYVGKKWKLPDGPLYDPKKMVGRLTPYKPEGSRIGIENILPPNLTITYSNETTEFINCPYFVNSSGVLTKFTGLPTDGIIILNKEPISGGYTSWAYKPILATWTSHAPYLGNGVLAIVGGRYGQKGSNFTGDSWSFALFYNNANDGKNKYTIRCVQSIN